MIAEALFYLALNIYHEARGEPIHAQIAVAEVTLNRVNSPNYPDTIKGVVTQTGGGSCAFSWYCDGKSDKPKDKKSWTRALFLADFIMDQGDYISVVGEDALFYHNLSVTPYWLSDVKKLTTVGNHVFYKKQ